MRPFLGIDITHDKHNRCCDGSIFLAERSPSAQFESIVQAEWERIAAAKQLELPQWAYLGRKVCELVWVGILCLCGILVDRAFSFSDIFSRYPWLISGLLVSFILWLVFEHLRKKWDKGTLRAARETAAYRRGGNNMSSQLGVPPSAEYVDILVFTYRAGKERSTAQPPWFNAEHRIFADAQYLYLVNENGKYAFPRARMSAITKVKRRIVLTRWNKPEDPRSSTYKTSKVRINLTGQVLLRCYYILEFSHRDETWGICFPSYELETFETLTRLTAKKK